MAILLEHYRAHLAKINHIDAHIYYFAEPNVSKYIYERIRKLVKHVTKLLLMLTVTCHFVKF